MVRFFEPEMDRRLSERYELQRDMRSAIAHGEFALHYQPQAKIDGEVFGFEALVRWFHPTRGLVPPSTFIPLAEQSGMIAEVGEWTLRQACTEAASWPRPLHRSSSVMVIWPASCKSVLADTGLAPGRLELEITEGVLINDQTRALATLRRPKLLGVKIAMDDFGTGYASLSGLQSFPFDKLKIDKTFVSGVESNAKSAEIVRAVIGLGRALKIPVIAEGVETAGERSFLMLEGCEELQGYLIGRPAPAATYAMLINGDRANVLMAG
ncbi:putative bifunctional diguanylate cyclase/phosphodiesterase [Methyloceanibacter sp.]|uniref:putative bifunctional diguanylate cyclase/phosphodiesterase n=1 Tax=Methyloceanibacter sp. TaxID=1965321 RepID=UPI003C7765EC